LGESLQTKPKSQMSDLERIRDFQRKLYRKAKQEKGFRFYVLYDKIRLMRFLRESYRRVRANGGVSGYDGMTFAIIEEYGVEKYLYEIHKELAEKTYKPSPVKRVYIPKANGKRRPLGIPTIKDRIVQMSCKMVIEPIFEADFEDSSYGFRPRRSAQGAIKKVKEHLKSGKTMVYDADVSSYFDSIPHEKLLILIGRRISDRNVIHLIKMWLKSPVEEDGRITGGRKNKKGTPQGGVISPLLANIYLHLLDRIVGKAGGMFQRNGIKLVRYADDFILMGREIPPKAMKKLNNVLTRMELELNLEKSKHIDARKTPFDFLGFTFRYDRSLYNRKTRYWNVIPSKKSEKKLREKISSYLRNSRHYPVEIIVDSLNRITRGWINYFNIPKVSYPWKTCRRLLGYMNWKLYRYYRRKSQRKCKLYRRGSFRYLVNHYGLIDPVKLLYN